VIFTFSESLLSTIFLDLLSIEKGEFIDPLIPQNYLTYMHKQNLRDSLYLFFFKI